MTSWTIDQSGLTASHSLPNGGIESRLLSAIPATDTILPCSPQTPQPNPNGFIQAIKTSMGGIVAANSLAIKYPLFFDTVSQGVWTDVQALIIDANTTLVINATQYTAIKAAATANNIPVTLP